MKIGKIEKVVTVEPLVSPVPEHEPTTPEPAPAVPEPKREEVPVER